jgi:uncharacterized protein
MKKEYNAPDIYVEETFKLPKSVAQVETAIPAFIGFTKKAFFKGQDLHLKNKKQPLEINSFSEFESIFGGPPDPSSVEIELDTNNAVTKIRTVELSFLYYSVKLFYENGGGTCLIVSVGKYQDAGLNDVKGKLLSGLSSVEKTDLPTLLVIPDVVKLSYAGAGEVHAAMLAQSYNLNNRFAIIDLVNGYRKTGSPENPVEQFRNNVGMNFLSHGAAYYPWLATSFSRQAGNNVILAANYYKNGMRIEDISTLFKRETLDALRSANSDDSVTDFLHTSAIPLQTNRGSTETYASALYEFFRDFFHLKFSRKDSSDRNPASYIHNRYIAEGSRFHHLVNRLHALFMVHNLSANENLFSDDFKPLVFPTRPVFLNGRNKSRLRSIKASLKLLAAEVSQLIIQFNVELETSRKNNHEKLKQSDTFYHAVVDAVEAQKIVVPPGGAVAGIISSVDREQGVWKAAANIRLNSVLYPSVAVSQNEQEFLKTDLLAGKSVNVIRMFTGRGVLIWGARTLSGNDNEWRYIQVRRLFIMVEHSVRESAKPFIFEANNHVTWQKVKAMVENFMIILWRAGALQGKKPDEAFFVNIGLGKTMTDTDILNGIMIMEIGLAVIRPAEFVVLKIIQKMQSN